MVTPMVAESWVQVGASSLNDTGQALEQALQALQCPQDPKLIVALLAPNFDLAAIAEQLYGTFPHTQVIGCTTSGEITPRRCGGQFPGAVSPGRLGNRGEYGFWSG